MRTTVVRLILFYVLAMALLLALMPWQEITPARSPFVRVFEIIGVPGAASVMNLVVLSAALSSMNTNLYITSRMLFSLARSGDAPKIFGQLGARGTPLAALGASAAGMAIAAVVAKMIPGDAFVWFFGVSIFGGLYVWAQNFATHLRYQAHQKNLPPLPVTAFVETLGRTGARAMTRQEAESHAAATKASEYAVWRVVCSAIGLVVMLAIIVTTWWVPGLKITIQSGVPWLVLLTVAWLIVERRKSSDEG
jgi:L-asparagine transporter-like permease